MITLTEKRATALVGLLPRAVQRELALGPTGHEHERTECCRVCMATMEVRERLVAMQDGWALPSTIESWTRRMTLRLVAVRDLHYWHRGYDIAARRDELLARGLWTPEFVLGEGEECFERCLVIYRAAGWQDPAVSCPCGMPGEAPCWQVGGDAACADPLLLGQGRRVRGDGTLE